MNSTDAASQESAFFRKTSRGALLVLVIFNAVIAVSVLRHVLQSNIDADEVEHAHVAWATHQGIMPYRDLHQIHTPMLWIVSAPLFGMLPESVDGLIALRFLCLLAFAGTYFVGLLILREVAGPIGRDHRLTLLLLGLSVLPAFELYRFRPDPFMTFFVALAILSAVRLGRAPMIYSLFGGVSLGIAASFSTKMAPLCLLVPIICLMECRRQRSLRPLLTAILHGVGFAIGLLPAAAWLFHYDLFDSFVHWTIKVNAHAVNFSLLKTLNFIDGCEVITVALIGWGIVVWLKPETLKAAWSPMAALLLSLLLALLIVLIAPNHMAYNLQIFAMPAAVLGTLLLLMLSDAGKWSAKNLIMFGAILLLVAGKPAFRGWDLIVPGSTIRIADLQKMIDLCPTDQDTCVGIAPWHPVFRRDATEAYIGWDLWFLMLPDMPEKGIQPYREMWSRSVSDIEKNRPTLIVDQELWMQAHKLSAISDDQYKQFLRLVKKQYNRGNAGNVSVFVRKKSPARK